MKDEWLLSANLRRNIRELMRKTLGSKWERLGLPAGIPQRTTDASAGLVRF